MESLSLALVCGAFMSGGRATRRSNRQAGLEGLKLNEGLEDTCIEQIKQDWRGDEKKRERPAYPISLMTV